MIDTYYSYCINLIQDKPYWSSDLGKCMWINKLHRSEPGSDFYEIKNAK